MEYGPRPYLVTLGEQDLSKNRKGGVANTQTITHFTGYEMDHTESGTKMDSKMINAAVSGTYGFSAITSVSATFGASANQGTTTTVTDHNKLNTSTTTSFFLTYPQGYFHGYYKWAVDLGTTSGTETLFLEEQIISLSTKEQKVELEATAQPVTIYGTPLSAAPTPTKENELRVRKIEELAVLKTAIGTFEKLLISEPWHTYSAWSGGRNPTLRNITRNVLDRDDIKWPNQDYLNDFLLELDTTKWHTSHKQSTRLNLNKIADNWLALQG